MITSDSHVSIENGYDLTVLWSIAWRSKYIVIVTGLVFCIAALIYAFMANQIFRAEVVVVQADTKGLGGAGAIAGQLGGLASLVGVDIGGLNEGSQESMAMLKSWRLAQEFVTRHKVYQSIQPPDKVPMSLWRTVKMFREGILTITEDKRNGTITIAIRWTDPVVAARWANDFVATVNELRRYEIKEEAERNIKYLNEQIAKTNVVELQRVSYNLIDGETKKLMLANARPDYAFTVVDPAVAPELRISPNRRMIVLTGGVLGGMIGLALGILFNALAARRARHSNLRSS